MAAAQTELEQLFVTLGMDPRPFVAAAVQVQRQIAVLNLALDSIAISVAPAAATLQAVSTQIGTVAAAFGTLATANVSGAATAIAGIVPGLTAMANLPSLAGTSFSMLGAADAIAVLGAANASNVVNNINAMFGPLTALSRIPLGNLSPLRHFAQLSTRLGFVRLNNLAGSLNLLTQSLSGLSVVLPSSAIDWLSQLIRLSSTQGLATLGGLTRALGNLGPVLHTLSTLGPIQDLSPFIASITQLSALSSAASTIGMIGRGLRALALSLGLLAGANITAATASLGALIPWLVRLGSLSPAVVGNVSRLGAALRSFGSFFTATGGTGAALPPILLSVANNTRGVTSASIPAARSVNTLSGSFRSLFTASGAAASSVNLARLSVLGFGGLGIATFARIDDQVTKIIAHMRMVSPNLSPELQRPTLTKGLMEQSLKSFTSQTDLAKGLDILASRGMSAAMAIEAMGVAEEFSVASGMDMGKATKKLVDIQEALGLNTEDVALHFSRMTDISDKFVSVAGLTGSSVDELTDAFGHRFLTAMRQNNITLSQGIAIQAAYSTQKIRGSDAADAGARAIYGLTHAANKHNLTLGNLKLLVYDSAGQTRHFTEIVDRLRQQFGALDPRTRAAQMEILGLERRVIDSLEPLIAAGHQLKELEDRINNASGATSRAAELLRSSFTTQLKIFWNHVVATAEVIGARLVPVLGFLMKGIESGLAWFIRLNPAIQSLIVLIASLTFGLRPALFLMRSLFSLLLSPVVGLTRLFSGIVSMVLIIPRALLGSLSLLGGGIRFLWGLVRGFGSLLSTAFSVSWLVVRYTILGVAHTVSYLVSLFRQLQWIVMNIGTALISLLLNVASFVFSLAGAFVFLSLVGGVLVTLGASLANLVGLVAGGIVSVWARVRDEIPRFFERATERAIELGNRGAEAWGRIKAGAPAVFEQLAASFQIMAGFFWNFQENMDAIFAWLKENWRAVAQDFGRAFVTITENTARNIRAIGNLILDVGVSVWKGFWESAKGYYYEFSHWFRAQWPNLLNDISVLFKAFLQAVFHNSMLIAEATSKGVMDKLTGVFDEFMGGGLDAEINRLNTSAALVREQTSKEIERAKKNAEEAKARTRSGEGFGLEMMNVRLDIDRRLKKRLEELNYQMVYAQAELTRDVMKVQIAAEKKKADAQAAIIAPFLSQIKGPADFMKAGEFKTNWADFQDRFTYGAYSASRAIEDAGKSIAQSMEQTFGTTLTIADDELLGWKQLVGQFGLAIPKEIRLPGTLVPAMAGFKPEAPWDILFKSLVTSLPKDAGDQILGWLRKFITPQGTAPEQGAVVGGQGPGFTFKQISLVRTLVGGPAAESLDYQQLTVLREIRGDTRAIATGLLSRGNEQLKVMPRELIGE